MSKIRKPQKLGWFELLLWKASFFFGLRCAVCLTWWYEEDAYKCAEKC